MLSRIIIAVAAVYLTLGSAMPAFVRPAGDNIATEAAETQQILVKFFPGTASSEIAAVHRKNKGHVTATIPGIGFDIVAVQGKAEDAARAYAGSPNVLSVEPDYVAATTGGPVDPLLAEQWGITDVKAPLAWDIASGDPTVNVAILDTGIDQDHEDLADKIVANVNFSQSPTVDDLFGHGTHVAGIVAAASNGLGVVGVAYNCSLMNVKVMNDDGSGYYSAIADGIVWAADNGAQVINMSLGGTSPSSALSSAVDYAWKKGVVLVAAAGNNNSSAPLYPAYYRNCVSVAATGPDDAKAYFSNYGRWVSVAAPGIAILSTLPNHGSKVSSKVDYGILSGTSMATPFVAGLAAILCSTPVGTSNSNVVGCIESSANKTVGTSTYWKYGEIDAWNAISLASQTGTTTGSGKGKGRK